MQGRGQPRGWAARRGVLLSISLVLGLSLQFWLAPPPPQPQGYVEVAQNTALIVRAAEAEGVPAIMVAAGIMNQGNAVTRPFGTDLLEQAQLAAAIDSPFTGVNASVDIAQLTPGEIRAYIPGCSRACLFEPAMAVQGMAAKLGAANALLPGSVDATDRLMVLALAQNYGPSAATAYLEAGGSWRQLYQTNQTGHTDGVYNNDQLRKILINIRYLLHNGFQLPPGVNLKRWQRIVDSQGASDRWGALWPDELTVNRPR